jgi:hypothetical protein
MMDDVLNLSQIDWAAAPLGFGSLEMRTNQMTIQKRSRHE